MNKKAKTPGVTSPTAAPAAKPSTAKSAAPKAIAAQPKKSLASKPASNPFLASNKQRLDKKVSRSSKSPR